MIFKALTNFFRKFLMAFLSFLFGFYCSDHTCGGGTKYSNGFFCSVILADRHIHRIEMRVVSLKSSSSVEFKIKMIFLIFVYFEELSRFKFCVHLHDFFHF